MRFLVLLIFLFSTGPVLAAPDGTGLPLPRFASVSAGKVNLRAGPGVSYRIEWVYRQAGLPVEIISEYRNWRRVRDWQGDEGWMHQQMLDGARTLITLGPERQTIRKTPEPDGPPVALVDPGVVGELVTCPSESVWCEVQIDGRRGWMDRGAFWGLLNGETINP